MSLFDEYNWEYTDECLLDSYKQAFQRIKKEDKKPSTYVYEDCYFLPLKPVLNGKIFFKGGILDSNKNFIEKAKIYPNRIYQGYDFNSQDVIYDEREVVFAGCFWKHWGHFILEEISRLWYFLKETNTDLPIVYLSTFPLDKNYLEFFELLGIDTKRLVFVDKLTQFKKVHIPEVSMVALSYYTEEYTKIYEKIRSSVKKDENYPIKVFFSRRNFPRSQDTDFGFMKEIETFFESNGYKFFSPENLSLKEQIKILQSCDEYVCVSGTLPHNLLFAGNQVQSIVLNKSYIVNSHQPIIEMATGIKSTYIDVHISVLPQHIGWGPFFFCPSDNLKSWANKKGYVYEESISNKNFLNYFYRYLYEYIFKMSLISKQYGQQIIRDDVKSFYINKIKNRFIIKFSLLLIGILNLKSKKIKTLALVMKYKLGL